MILNCRTIDYLKLLRLEVENDSDQTGKNLEKNSGFFEEKRLKV